MNFYSDAPGWGVRSAYSGLSNTNHTFEMRGLSGRIYFDNVQVDGRIFFSNTEFVEETTTYTGSMGPSVEGTPETRSIPFEVDANTIQVGAELSWNGGVDIDLYLLDPDGKQVSSSASLDNPEAFTYWVERSGTYTYKIVGYLTVAANFTLKSTLSKAITTPPTRGNSLAEVLTIAPPQNNDLVLNYPNPFNPRTTIVFSLSAGTFVSLRVYNILGMEVATLINGVLEAGTHRIPFHAQSLPSGVYMYKLDAGGKSKLGRMVLLK